MTRPQPAPMLTTVDGYIAAYPAAVQEVLERIRAIIRAAAPTARERISYRLPTYDLPGGTLHFGAFKSHIGLYPPVRDPQFQARVAPYRGEKGNLQFPFDRPIPYDLIEDIAAARAKGRAPAR